MKKIKIKIFLLMGLLSCVLFSKKEDFSNTSSVLTLIHEHLTTEIHNCTLEQKLVLTNVFTACDLLQKLHELGKVLSSSDEKIIESIICCVNDRLMSNPAFILFLENLNKSAEPYRRLSDNAIATIIKNSALLVSIDELFSFAEIVATVRNYDHLKIDSKRLDDILASVELDRNKMVLELWEKRDFLKNFYMRLSSQAVEKSEKEKYKKEAVCIKKNIDEILLALEVTTAYATVLKRLKPISYQAGTRLCELYEEAYSGEKGTLSLEAYALFVKNSYFS